VGEFGGKQGLEECATGRSDVEKVEFYSSKAMIVHYWARELMIIFVLS
jgi:hypothetical protein